MRQSKTGAFDFAVVEGEFIKNKDLATLELEASRRALALLKNRLGAARMLELIREEVEETDRLWEGWAAESGDEWRVNLMEFKVSGLPLSHWLKWVFENFTNESMHFAAHPEHYAWTQADRIYPDCGSSTPIVCEPMGEFMMRATARIEKWDGYEAYIDPDYPHHLTLMGYTINGIPISRSLSQFRETEDGFFFRLTAMKPAKIPPAMRERNQEHGFLEYAKYFKFAYDDYVGS